MAVAPNDGQYTVGELERNDLNDSELHLFSEELLYLPVFSNFLDL